METEITTVQSQQLTGKQQALYNKIAKDGTLTEIAFVRKTIEFKKIREYNLDIVEEKQDLTLGLASIFIKASNLLGIKNPISQINKDDIIELILRFYKNMSLQEIDYAFKLERYSKLDPKTEHYQLFNAEYVGLVLKKYTVFRQKTRLDNNLPLTKSKSRNNELSDEEKEIIVLNGAIQCFEDFKITHKIEDGKSHIYDYLYEKRVFPKHTPKFVKKIKRKASKDIYNKKKTKPREYKDILKKVVQGKTTLKTECKRIVLKTYFVKLIKTNKTLTQDIKEKFSPIN